ncbi:methionine--tRNA ligase [Candidatus Microgenomates bacterium]|jgi:methionyl-tRNA synthetase|nr:MAG: methionine--tRNA ligase [Candidatus Microgenomates bacterium]
MEKPVISYSDFSKLDLRIGTVLEVKEVEGSEKLLELSVDLGDPPVGEGKRTILSGIKNFFKPEEIVGLQVLVLANLETKRMAGKESEGMVLMAVEGEGEFEKIVLLVPQDKVPPGTGVF